MKAYFVIELDDGTTHKIELPISKVDREITKEVKKASKPRSNRYFNKAILGVLYAIQREKGENYTPTLVEIKKALEVTEEEEEAFNDALKWLAGQGRIIIRPIQGTTYVILVNKDQSKGTKQEKKQKKSIRRFKDIIK